MDGSDPDEAQNVKNSETLQAKAARSLNALWRIALTGTPVENHVGDLWSLFEFLNPGLLGGEAEFKREFFVPIQARQTERRRPASSTSRGRSSCAASRPTRTSPRTCPTRWR